MQSSAKMLRDPTKKFLIVCWDSLKMLSNQRNPMKFIKKIKLKKIVEDLMSPNKTLSTNTL